MSKTVKEFKDFVMQGNVLLVAVGLIMALAFKSIVDAFIEGVITPLVGAILGKPVDGMTISIGKAALNYGLVINAALTFVITALVLFALVKAYNKFMHTPDAPPTEVELLTEIRDSLRANR